MSLGTTNDVEDTTAAAAAADNEDYAVPHYSGSGEDYEKQSELKRKAADAKNDGKLEEALQLYNEAVEAAPPSALLYANRSIVLVQLGHFPAAELDCKLALEQNPDSAKALKTRGKLRYQHLQDWEGALRYASFWFFEWFSLMVLFFRNFRCTLIVHSNLCFPFFSLKST